MANPEDILNGEASVDATTPIIDLESKRESLSILACLGSTKEYTGVVKDLSDTTKLSDKDVDVDKYYKRYQVVSGKKIADGLADSSFQLIAKAVDQGLSKFGNIDDQDALVRDCKNDQLIMKEISNISGFLVLKGGRLTALLSGFIHIAKHFKLREHGYNSASTQLEQDLSTTPTQLEQDLSTTPTQLEQDLSNTPTQLEN